MGQFKNCCVVLEELFSCLWGSCAFLEPSWRSHLWGGLGATQGVMGRLESLWTRHATPRRRSWGRKEEPRRSPKGPTNTPKSKITLDMNKHALGDHLGTVLAGWARFELRLGITNHQHQIANYAHREHVHIRQREGFEKRLGQNIT